MDANWELSESTSYCHAVTLVMQSMQSSSLWRERITSLGQRSSTHAKQATRWSAGSIDGAARPVDGMDFSQSVKDDLVLDDQMTSSSVYRSFGTKWHPYFGRLDETGLRNAWRAGTNNQLQWLQVDLGCNKTISGIITQGGGHAVSGTSYVTSFKVSYSDDGGPGTVIKDADGSHKIFPGNGEEQEEHKKNMFEPPITSRYVRVLPWTWERHITMRIELLGCEATP